MFVKGKPKKHKQKTVASEEMSDLQPDSTLAILCSDLHLSHKPPLIRDPKTWMEVQADALLQLGRLSRENNNAPIICAGDVFDHWDQPPSMITFCIERIPKNFYAIPGQHDIPYHSYKDIFKSSYWTLVTAGVINHLDAFTVLKSGTGVQFLVTPFPWGHKLKGSSTPVDKTVVTLAVVHRYLWKKGYGYENAPVEEYVKNIPDKVINCYSSMVFGDNHQGFKYKVGETSIINTGTLLRRKKDELDYTPQVGILLADGTIKTHKLDCSKDKFVETSEVTKDSEWPELNLDELITDLKNIKDKGYDFVQSVKRFLKQNKIDKYISQIVMEALEQ